MNTSPPGGQPDDIVDAAMRFIETLNDIIRSHSSEPTIVALAIGTKEAAIDAAAASTRHDTALQDLRKVKERALHLERLITAGMVTPDEGLTQAEAIAEQLHEAVGVLTAVHRELDHLNEVYLGRLRELRRFL